MSDKSVATFIGRSVKLGLVLGAGLGAIFPLAFILIMPIVWASSQGIIITSPPDSSWLVGNLIPVLVWYIPSGIILGLANGTTLGTLSKLFFNARSSHIAQYRFIVAAIAFLVNFIGGYLGFMVLLSPFAMEAWVLSATMVAGITGIYASQRIATWYFASQDTVAT